MLGRTAGGLFWMFRYIERSENTARLVGAGQRIALTRSTDGHEEWRSVLATANAIDSYLSQYDQIEASKVINYLLRDPENPSSVISVITAARINARRVRTALTRELWEAVNEGWMVLKDVLARPVTERTLPDVLATIRQQSGLVRSALHGTMLRNEIFNFCRLGTFSERADSTARILDVKYYVLLPSISHVGGPLDNVQWETILRSCSAERAFQWLNGAEMRPLGIASFLILDPRFPRSLYFCAEKIANNLRYLAHDYGEESQALFSAQALVGRLAGRNIDDIVEEGLHEFIVDFIGANNALGAEIEREFRFYR